MCQASAEYRLFSSFNDIPITPATWDSLSPSVFQTWHWLKAWWETFGRGQLMLILAESGGCPKLIAPLFCDGGMVFSVGSGGSDYLDFPGSIEPDVLTGALRLARDSAREFVGFRFYHVPDKGGTGGILSLAAANLGLRCFEEDTMQAPMLDLQQGANAPDKRSLVRHERWFQREGELRVVHSEPTPRLLEEFFEQHIERWAATPHPSLFLDQDQRTFYRRVAEAKTEWLRFTRVEWNAQPVAFHYGFCFRRSFLWYKPSFDIRLAKRSPGEVLLRNLLLRAMEEGARTFDFGLGDEAFKQRFATGVSTVRTWGLYP